MSEAPIDAFFVSRVSEKTLTAPAHRLPRFDRLKSLFSFIPLIVLFLIAYPRPAMFAETVYRLFRPPIDPQAVAAISEQLPNDPRQIEAWVKRNVAYDAQDYTNWGVLYYFPTVAEVLPLGKGQCTGRAAVMASIFEDKGIPYRIYMMPVHLWVDYPGRVPQSPFERPEYALADWQDGHWQLMSGNPWWQALPKILDFIRPQLDSAIPRPLQLTFVGFAGFWVLAVFSRKAVRAKRIQLSPGRQERQDSQQS